MFVNEFKKLKTPKTNNGLLHINRDYTARIRREHMEENCSYMTIGSKSVYSQPIMLPFYRDVIPMKNHCHWMGYIAEKDLEYGNVDSLTYKEGDRHRLHLVMDFNTVRRIDFEEDDIDDEWADTRDIDDEDLWF